jgi:hypothetical protein
MIDRTADRFGLRPERLAGDTAYGSAEMLNWLVEERNITPHIPVIDKSARRDGTFAREDFRYNHDSDTYTCPAGKTLTTSGTPATLPVPSSAPPPSSNRAASASASRCYSPT